MCSAFEISASIATPSTYSQENQSPLSSGIVYGYQTFSD